LGINHGIPIWIALCLIAFPGLSAAQAIVQFYPSEASQVHFQSETDDPELAPEVSEEPSTQVAAAIPEPQGPERAADDAEFEASEVGIPDPFEPLNRISFQFNDKLYFWLLKPVAVGYKAVVSQEYRVCFRNFFQNLIAPVRVVNCALQGKFKGAGNETARFFINTTLGFLGLFDQGKDKFNIDKCDEDFGQTLGFWGMKPVFYLEWPVLGSSSLRDTIGFVGDMALDFRTYLTRPIFAIVRPFELENEVSLMIGQYEDLKEAAIDPYVAKRDAYHQYRNNKIME
jgi:phospholipid-binding lipoprotein MlaA